MSTATRERLECEIEGESLQRYRPGGYHPVHLGDKLHQRYTIVRKLGWGGYATTWQAFDSRREEAVSIKICVSEPDSGLNEVTIHRMLSMGPGEHCGKRMIPRLFDTFVLDGPNGQHHCLVTELLGPSVSSTTETLLGGRLPGRIAWSAVRELVQALSYMHHLGIAHGDVHPGNILFAKAPDKPGDCRRGEILAAHYGPHLPRYMVEPRTVPWSQISDKFSFKLIDYGSSSNSTSSITPRMRCPLPFRAPEAVLTDTWNSAADIWSLGCTIFTLVTGYPPFDSMLVDERELLSEWIATLGRPPQSWDRTGKSFENIKAAELDTPDIREWLKEAYLDDDAKKPFFSQKELHEIGELILSMLKYEPSCRPSADDLLQHPLIRNGHSIVKERCVGAALT